MQGPHRHRFALEFPQRLLKPLGGLMVASADAGKEAQRPKGKAWKPAPRRVAQREPPPIGCGEGHEQPPALAQPIEPEWPGWVMPAKVMMTSTSPGSWVVPSPVTTSACAQGRNFPGRGRKASVILDRHHGPGCPDDLGQHRAVVPGTGPDLHDSPAGPQI